MTSYGNSIAFSTKERKDAAAKLYNLVWEIHLLIFLRIALLGFV